MMDAEVSGDVASGPRGGTRASGTDRDPSRIGSAPQITVLVPVRDEEESIPVLAAEVEAVLDALARPWEMLWVDDGSIDGTLARLRDLRTRRVEHRWISFDRNYGQSAAFAAGFRHARGGIVVTLDADLQNDPRDIPNVLAILDRGAADMVNGVRERRQDSWVRLISSRVANRFRNWLTGESVSDVGCSLRAFRREFVVDVPLFRGMHRFLPTLARLQGARLAEVPVRHRPRRFGQTKYGVGNRLWVGIEDTMGVRWLLRRAVRPVVARDAETEAGDAREAGGPAA
jgi:dolichol-phosphate mannosyltransferase